MPPKIEVDLEKLKQLHAEGLSDREIAEKLGGSGAMIRMRRIELGLPVVGRRGRGPGADARKSATRPKRSAIASAGGNFQRRGKAGAAGTATIHLSAAGLDRLWQDLSLETKADLIEQILGN